MEGCSLSGAVVRGPAGRQRSQGETRYNPAETAEGFDMMRCDRVVFSGHAVRRMFKRRISREEVLEAIARGETIAEYPEDEPYPSVLLLATVGGRVLHIVVAEDAGSGTCYIVTVYLPDPGLWSPDFRTRRTS